ncbi:MAG: hypothetical protein [Microviridae sp.]|nr:MAG: hypothetical protein [Microviridae sp.]
MAIDLSGYDPWPSVGGVGGGGMFSGSNLASSAASIAGAVAGSPWLGAVGGFLGGALGGGDDKEAARRAYHMQVKQLWLQDEMFRSGVRVRQRDLKAAGLNPMLAGMNQSSASAPLMSPGFFPTRTAAASSAQRGAEVGSGVMATFASIAKTLADTQLASAQASAVPSQIQSNIAHADEMASQTTVNQAKIKEISQSIYESMSREDLNDANQTEILKGRLPKLISDKLNVDADTGLKITEQFLKELNIPEAYRKSEMFKGDLGKYIPYIEPLTKAINSVTGIVGIGTAIKGLRDLGPVITNSAKDFIRKPYGLVDKATGEIFTPKR